VAAGSVSINDKHRQTYFQNSRKYFSQKWGKEGYKGLYDLVMNMNVESIGCSILEGNLCMAKIRRTLKKLEDKPFMEC
jgi:hypothetical protein